MAHESNLPDSPVELHAQKVAERGLCAVEQAGWLRYKLLGGLAVRRRGGRRWPCSCGMPCLSHLQREVCSLVCADCHNRVLPDMARSAALVQFMHCPCLRSRACAVFSSSARACYGVLRFIMESGAMDCEVNVSGKLRAKRAKAIKVEDGFVVLSGNPMREYTDGAVRARDAVAGRSASRSVKVGLGFVV